MHGTLRDCLVFQYSSYEIYLQSAYLCEYRQIPTPAPTRPAASRPMPRHSPASRKTSDHSRHTGFSPRATVFIVILLHY